jgi:hypothetical protein
MEMKKERKQRLEIVESPQWTFPRLTPMKNAISAKNKMHGP